MFIINEQAKIMNNSLTHKKGRLFFNIYSYAFSISSPISR